VTAHRVLVTGAGGFIGAALVAALGPERARPVGHTAIDRPDLLDEADVVVHAGRDPRLGTADHTPEADLEHVLARRAAERGLPFITLSTRKVYAPSAGPIAETAPPGAADRYGAQKRAMEDALADVLGSDLTILRLANIVGFEPGRRSFTGAMLDRLAGEGEIRFDMSPFTRRDFVPVEVAAGAIAKLTENPPAGVVNIGSGLGLACGRLALAVIEGFGRLVIDRPEERDAFSLDVARLRRLTGIAVSEPALLAYARSLGRRLAGSGEARP